MRIWMCMYLYRIIGKTMGFTFDQEMGLGWPQQPTSPRLGGEDYFATAIGCHTFVRTHTHQYRLARQPPAPHTPTPTHAYVFAHARAHIKGVGLRLTYRHTCKHILVQMSLQVNMCVKTVPVQKAS